MGEKTGTLTNMIIVVATLVIILLGVKAAFPDLTDQVTDGMGNIISDSLNEGNFGG